MSYSDHVPFSVLSTLHIFSLVTAYLCAKDFLITTASHTSLLRLLLLLFDPDQRIRGEPVVAIRHRDKETMVGRLEIQCGEYDRSRKRHEDVRNER